MKKNDVAHNSFWKTSDFIVGITLLLGLVLHFVPLLTVVVPLPRTTAVIAGVILICSGIIIIVLAKWALKQAEQPAGPGQPTTQIVETGPYRYSRNPIYLGLVFVLSGFGLAFSIAWWLVLVIPMMLALKHLLILPEEKYLFEKFGEQYTDYSSKVRRWF